MLNLTTRISLTAEVISSPNLCYLFDDADRIAIGDACYRGYDLDEKSRATWLARSTAGMDLALQVQKAKSFPWEGCSNVAFPLITIAAMQFHARAYPAILGDGQVVKCSIYGDDESGDLGRQAERIEDYMNWQLHYEDVAWEEQVDKALFNLAIVGTNFKKSYYSASLQRNVSELVLAKDLVVNYWAKTLDEAPRRSHLIPRFRNEVYENVKAGLWHDILSESWYTSHTLPPPLPAGESVDKRQGITPPQPDGTTTLLFIEQHCNLDLDGDGYAEPYIITFEATSRTVVRIVTNFDSEDAIERVKTGANRGQVLRIKPVSYFTKNSFIPAPDGGFYDIGFGVFLGPLNESVNSIVNMLTDAGTLQVTSGGFLGRGVKIRGGNTSFSPFEWKRVDSSGDDLRKGIFSLPVPPPSDVLFSLLSLLIDYTNRISNTTDITVGENPGQNTPATTALTMVEMGQKIYTAIFKRVWRSAAEEFRKLYRLNGIYMAQGIEYPGGATREDFQSKESFICPEADPAIVSDTIRLHTAMALKTAAASTAGYNTDEVERNYLRALRVGNISRVYTGTEDLPPPPPDPALVLAQQKLQQDSEMQQGKLRLQEEQLMLKQEQLKATAMQFILSFEEERRVNNAKVAELLAKASEASANAQSEAAYAQVAQINAEISAAQAHNKELTSTLDRLFKVFELQQKEPKDD